MQADDDFPSAGQALLVVLAVMLVEYLVGALLHDFRRSLNLSLDELQALALLLGNGVVFTVLMQVKGLDYKTLVHASPSSPAATFGLLLVPIVMLVPGLALSMTALGDVLVRWLPLSRWETQVFERMAGTDMPTIVAACVLAPVLEEMLFRGVFLRAFLHRYPRWQAIFYSALIFGFAHLNIYQFVVAFLMGSIAGWLYERTRSLLPCILLHASYNTSLSFFDAQAGDAAAQSASVASPTVWYIALGAAGGGAAILWRLLGERAHAST